MLNPAVVFLQRHRFRRGSAVGLVFVAAALAFAGLLALFGYPLVNSLTHVAERLPTMVDQVQKGHGWLAHTLQRLHLLTWVQKNAPRLKAAAQSLGKPALSVGTNLASAVFTTILALSTIAFLSLFMLLEAPQLRRGFLGAINPGLRQTIEEIATTVSRSVTSYVLGTIALSLLFGLVIFVTMLVLGVPFALLIGLWVALVAMIPLVGGLIAAVPSVVLATLHTPTAGVVTLIVFVGFQLVENHFLYPVVMSRTVRMNPLWVLLAVLVGANLGGVFGSSLGCADRGADGDPGGGRDPGRLPRGLGSHPGVPGASGRLPGDTGDGSPGDPRAGRRPGGGGARKERRLTGRIGLERPVRGAPAHGRGRQGRPTTARTLTRPSPGRSRKLR